MLYRGTLTLTFHIFFSFGKKGLQNWNMLYNRPFEACSDMRSSDHPDLPLAENPVSRSPTGLRYPGNEQQLNKEITAQLLPLSQEVKAKPNCSEMCLNNEPSTMFTDSI